MTGRKLLALTGVLVAIAGIAFAPLAAQAAPDFSGTSIINEPNGFPGVCDAPCFAVQKLAEVWFAGNATGPIACGAGENLFVYTLTHLGGSIDPAPPINRFELEADDALVASAGFIPGAGVPPSTTTVSPLDVVSWEFMAPPIFQGQTSEQLYICATGAVGSPTSSMISIGGGPLDAPGECIGPIPGAECEIDLDKTCCIPFKKLPGDDDGDSDSHSSSDSDSDTDKDWNGDSDGHSDSHSSSDSDSDTDRGNICNGKVVRAVFEVTGGDCGNTTNSQGGKAECSGPNPVQNPVLDSVTVTATGYYASQIRINGSSDPVTVPVGSTIAFTSVSTPNQLPYSTSFSLTGPGGTQKLKIITSCHKGMGCSDQFGSVKLVELETTENGVQSCDPGQQSTTCIPPEGEVGDQAGDGDADTDSNSSSDSDSASDNDANGDSDGSSDSQAASDSDSDSDLCSGGIAEATFQFTPKACQNPLPNPQNGYAKCSGDASDATLPVGIIYTGKSQNNTTVSPASGIVSGGKFRVTATGMKTLSSNLKLAISDSNSVEQSLEINVGGCKQLRCGDEFGSLKLLGFTRQNGRKVSCDPAAANPFKQSCECPAGPPKPHCTGSLEGLKLVYLKELFGADCSVSNSQGGQASCSGDNLVGDDVSIQILTTPSSITATPSSNIDEKGVFTITKKVDNVAKALPATIQFVATDGNANSQTITLKTDCSKALDLGDRFGDFAVFCLDRGDGDGHDGWGDSDSDSDSDSDPVAETAGEDGEVCLGCEIEYQYKLTNPNATGLTDITLVDDKFSPPPIATGETLAPGESKTFFLTQTLYDSTTNTATATGELETGGECTAEMDSVDVTVTLPPQGAFDCANAKPISQISMKWNGTQSVSVKAWKGNVGNTLLLTDTSVAPGEVVKVTGITNSTAPVWEIFQPGGTVTKIGESRFDLSCYDTEMNGIEDCGRSEGNGKYNTPTDINDWLFEGMAGDESLACTPVVVASGRGPCGLVGVEVVPLLAGLFWLRSRRRKQA